MDDFAGRVGEINVLENTMGALESGRLEGSGMDAMLIDADNFARLDFTDERCADGIEGACLAGHTPEPIFHFSDHQRPDAPRVAAGFDSVRKHKQQAERALQMLQDVRERIVLLGVSRLGEQMDDDFRVGCALENVAMLFVLTAEQRGIDEIAIMCNGDRAEQEFSQQRLCVTEFA